MRIPLTLADNGVAGWLEVQLDPRLTPAAAKKLWDNGPWDQLDENDRLYKSFSKHPPKNATLCIVDTQGQIIESKTLDRPLAKIETIELIPRQTNFILTVDYSAGFGSYSGPASDVMEVQGGHIVAVNAVDAKSGKSEPIHIFKTLKSDWKLSSKKGGKDILAVYCRPKSFSGSAANFTDSDDDFETTYVRYHFDGSKWVKHQRTETGFWENEGDFPPSIEFP